MSLGTTILVCLAAIFFGGIVFLDRVNRKRQAESNSAGTAAAPKPSESKAPLVSEAQPPSPSVAGKVTPLARPKKNRARDISSPQPRHGT